MTKTNFDDLDVAAGSITAVEIGSGNAPAGQVLTADGAGGAAWDGPGYLEYVALLTQSGTSAPVATVLKNTLGGTVVWSYVSQGNYMATLTGAFPETKTGVQATLSFTGQGNGGLVEVVWNDVNSLAVATKTVDLVNGEIAFLDYMMAKTPVEIRVYP